MLTNSTYGSFTTHHHVSLYQPIPDQWIPPSRPLDNPFGHFEAVLKTRYLLSSKMIKPLKMVLMNRDNHDIKLAMTKNEGYFSRLFSNESWDEWTESKSELGRVIELYADFIENGAPLSSIMKRLDTETIRKAIDQAHEALNNSQPLKKGECTTNLALGTMMTLSTQNPLPLAIATTSCLHEHASAGGIGGTISRGLKKAGKDLSNTGKTAGKDLSNTGKTAGKDLSNTAKIAGRDFSNTFKIAGKDFSNTAKIAGKDISNTGKIAGRDISNTAKIAGNDISNTGKVAGRDISNSAKKIYDKKYANIRYHGELTLKPFETYSADNIEKISLCKNGALDPNHACNYDGANLRVSIIDEMKNTIYDGPFKDARQWINEKGNYQILIENDQDQVGTMYMHLEDSRYKGMKV